MKRDPWAEFKPAKPRGADPWAEFAPAATTTEAMVEEAIPLPAGVEPSTAGAGRSAGVGGPTREEMRSATVAGTRRGAMPRGQSFGAGLALPPEYSEGARTEALRADGEGMLRDLRIKPSNVAGGRGTVVESPADRANYAANQAPARTREEAIDRAVALVERGAPFEDVTTAFGGSDWGLTRDEIESRAAAVGVPGFEGASALSGVRGNFDSGRRAVPQEMISATGVARPYESDFGEDAQRFTSRVGAHIKGAATSNMIEVARAFGVNPKAAAEFQATEGRRTQDTLDANAVSEQMRRGLGEISKAKTVGEALSAMGRNPAATTMMLGESAAVSLPLLMAALIPGGRVARAVGVGGASAAMEYGGALGEELDKLGVPPTDVQRVQALLQDREFMSAVRARGVKRGLAVGAVDGLTALFAGGFVASTLKKIESGAIAPSRAKWAVAGAWAKELAAQAGAGAGGEGLGQAAVGEYKPADILLEAIAEVPGATLEARSNLRAGAAAVPRPDPYAAASAAGFHVEPPLTTDTTQDQRKKTEAILDGVAAQYGIPPNAVRVMRKAAEGMALSELGPAYATAIQVLQRHGLAPAEIAPEVMQALTAGAVQPIADQPAAGPVAESQAPAPSEPGDGGAAPTRAGGGPQLDAVASVERTLRAAGALADMSDFEAATHDAATSPLNDRPEPTDAQKAAGNYKVGRVRISGLDVSIENPKGSVRRSKADAPQPWEVVMPAHYGYIRGTKGADGDHVDIFVGPGEDNGRFWVINQTTPDGKKFDEHKVVTGVDSADEAVALYKASFANGFGDKVFDSIGREMTADQLREVLPSLERPKPLKTAAPRLQNRNRSDAGYVQQMQSIAANPDPGRLGFSRDFASGAPVVLDAGSTPGAAYGRSDYVATSKGRRIKVRYAVVEADSLLPSNAADGAKVAGYEAGQPGRARVVAGNGRAAGLAAAYERGTAKGYSAGLAEDAALHGIDAEALARFKRPVLVREMGAVDLTADIGDESNVTGVAERSSPEVARDDARRIDLAGLEFDEDGNLTNAALRRFIDSMPTSEQTALRDARGNPTRQAGDRLTAAVFAAAYENDALLALQAQAADPEARTVLAGLVAAAPAMARLKGMGDLDIRGLVAEAAEAAVNARRRGIKLADMAAQQDLDADPEVARVLLMFAKHSRSARRIGDNLRAAANLAFEEATKPTEDMLGEVPRRSRAEVLKESTDDTAGTQDLGQQARAEPDVGAARRRAAEPDSPRGDRSAQEERAAERPARSAQQTEMIELRKRVAVLESLRACLAG